MLKNTPAKRAENPKYQKFEKHFTQTLLKILKKSGRNLSLRPCHIYKISGSSKSTFFNHYTDANSILEQEELRILSLFEQKMRPLYQKSASLDLIMYNFLFFLYRHRYILDAELSNHDYTILYKLLISLKPRIIPIWKNYSMELLDKLYEKYLFIVFAIIDDWHTYHFNEQNIEKYLQKLIYFTRHADTILLKLDVSSSTEKINLDFLVKK